MADIYAMITDAIIEDLEKGIIPWRRKWSIGTQGCFSFSTGKRYSLLNTLLLGGVSGDYVTYKGAQKAGGQVRKGEKSKTVVFWNMLEKEDENGNKDFIPLLRSYNVFHVSQCDGLVSKHAQEVQLYDTKPIDSAEQIIADYAKREALEIHTGDYNEAFYSPAEHSVQLPRIGRFEEVAEYYSTVFHELAHSTAKTLKREQSAQREAYAREELVAELASAFIMNICGLDTMETFENSEGYIQGWLKALRNDKRLIVSASSRAEKAVALILNLQESAE